MEVPEFRDSFQNKTGSAIQSSVIQQERTTCNLVGY